MNVLVTGAGGKTGAMVLQRLMERKDTFVPRGLVRSQKSVDSLKTKLGAEVEPLLVMGDVTKADTLTKAFEGVESIVIVSSAMPQLNFWSLPGTIFRKMVGNKTAKPDFYYAPGGEPEEVDWKGQKNQIDAAKAAGVKHIVLVMFLNNRFR
jgi:nucleoside-diphosphate-sugar epimerase